MQPPLLTSSKTFLSLVHSPLTHCAVFPVPPPAWSLVVIWILSVWIYQFWIFYINGVIQYVTFFESGLFCVWHNVYPHLWHVCYSFSGLQSTPLCVCHNRFIHLLMEPPSLLTDIFVKYRILVGWFISTAFEIFCSTIFCLAWFIKTNLL